MKQKEMEDSMIRLFRKMLKIDFSSHLHGISREEFFMLEVIDRGCETDGREEGISVSAIAKALDVSSPAVSRMVRGIERKGYVTRRCGRWNRRNTMVRLTEKGTLTYGDSKKELDRWFLRVMDYMGQKDMEQLLKLWDKLAQGFVTDHSLCGVYVKGDGQT